MNLARVQERFTVFAVTLAGILLAVYCGTKAGSGDLKSLGEYAGLAVAVIVFLRAKERCWLLIPFSWILGAKSHLLPLPFGVHDVFTLFAFGTFLVLNALKAVPRRHGFSLLDLLVFINLLYLATVYVRNPVGVEALHTDMIGGMPYYLVIIASMGYWVLSRAKIRPTDPKLILVVIFGTAVALAALDLVTFFVPATVPIASHIYEGVEGIDKATAADEALAGAPQDGPDEDAGSSRIASLAGFGLNVMVIVLAFYPVSSLFRPNRLWALLLFCIGLIGMLQSGHRLTLISMFFIVIIIIYARRGAFEVCKLLAIGLPLILILVIGNGKVFKLPYTTQRTLAFLPGNWDYDVVQDTQGSNDWRIAMWRRAWEGNRWMKNKIFGEGFGFSRPVWEQLKSSEDSGVNIGQEILLLVGGFHNGPLSAIRFVGMVGLFLYYCLSLYLVFYAWKLMMRSKGTPYFPLSLYFCPFTIVGPFIFTFVFGAFENDLPATILFAGMLKMLKQAVDQYEKDNMGLNLLQDAPGSNLTVPNSKYPSLAPASL